MAKKQQIQDTRFQLYDRAHTKEYYAVAKWLSEVKFSPAVLGVDEADVWRKLEKLCELYEDALNAERARNAKLERKLRSLSAQKRVEPAAKQEAPKIAPVKKEEPAAAPAQEKPVAADPIPLKTAAPAKPEWEEKPEAKPMGPQPTVQEASAEPAPEKENKEEDILLDLIREFGPEKGGKPNG